MARDVISLAEAAKPEFNSRQIDFCRDLIGMGLTHLTIIGLVLDKDVKGLDHAQVSSGSRLIGTLKRELGYGVMDARRAQSPHMQAAVRACARTLKVRVRIA